MFNTSKVARPSKSILINPQSSTTRLSQLTTGDFPLVSSTARLTIGSPATTIPAACWPNDFIVPASLVACFQITGCSLRNLSSSGTASAEVFRSSDVPCSLSTSLVALNCMLFKPLIRPVSRRAEAEASVE
ncbi:hypothetical protein MWMV1_MWMV1_03544 [Acinetobacter baumannii]|nr:hypothetical protein MWMV6_MWMV6_03511 [Acinetobacter baumannii]CAI4178306.1 hypothetical protein MWMV1_MWMV1_03544 [Acinetobacter baumannii]